MRKHFARLPDAEKQAAYTQAALRANTLPVITEKDFWVCWLLGRIYAMPALGAHCVFKGGTSLSKVFGIRSFGVRSWHLAFLAAEPCRI